MTSPTQDGAKAATRTDLDFESFKNRLLALKQSTEQTIAEMRAQGGDGDTTGTDRTELSDSDNHPADQGTDLQLREQDAALVANERSVLAQVERALEKIADGTYGISDGTQKPIPAERLDAIPYANYNVDEEM